MSSAANSSEWTISGLWAIQKNANPSASQPGAALPDKARHGIAGQISEHLRYATRRLAAKPAPTLDEAGTPSEEPPAPAETQPIPPTAEAAPAADAPQTVSAPGDQTPSQPEGTPYLTFRLGKVHWGIPAIYLHEVLQDLPPVTPLPFSPIWLHGVINLRGEAVGLIKLSDLLLDPVIAASAARSDSASPVIVAEHEGIFLALQVHELGEVKFLEDHQISHLSGAQTRSLPAFAVSHLQAAWFSDPSRSPLLLLNLPKLMASLLEQMTAQEALSDG